MNYSTRNNLIFMLAFALIVGGYFFVKRKNNVEKNVEKKEVSSPQKNEESEASLLKKLNTCIGCVNRNRERARDSYNRYASWVKDMEKGPIGDERHKYGLYTIYGGQYYCDNLQGEKMLPPELPEIDAKIADYLEAMRKLEAILIKVDKYYDNEDWKDDGMRKGKEMHPELVQHFNDFFDAESALIESVKTGGSSIADGLPPLVIALTDNVFLITKNIQQNPDVTTLKKLIDETEAQSERLSELPDYKENFESFENETNDLLKSAKKIMRNLKDGKPYNDEKRYFFRDINEWITAFNRLKPENSFLHIAEIQ